MKALKYLVAIMMAILLPNILFAQMYPLQVIITQKQKFTPFIGQFSENPGEYLSLQIMQTGATQQNRNIYLKMKLQQVTPTNDISIISNLATRPIEPIRINPTGSTNISPYQIKENFGNFRNASEFEIRGINISEYTDLTGSLRIPEGQYMLCFTAYDFDAEMGKIVPLSNPEMGCLMINICYEASQPQWVMPMNSLIEGGCFRKQIEPQRILTFQWNPPMNNCGLNTASTTYDLNIVEILNDQTDDDAIQNNPPAIRRQNLNTTTFLIDTLVFPNIFSNGKIYAAQVTARNNDQSIEYKNAGKSPTCSFIYGTQDTVPKMRTMMGGGSMADVDCGVGLPDDKQLIKSLVVNDEITIGNYKMKISQIEINPDQKSFKGEGVIINPGNKNFEIYNWVNVKVEFNELAVNRSKYVIGGNAYAKYDNSNNDYITFFKSFHTSNLVWWNNNKDKINAHLKTLSGQTAAQPNSENLLPIKIGDKEKAVAISSIIFSAKGCKLSLLHFIKDIKSNTILPFGISDVCANSALDANKFKLLKEAEIDIGKNTKLAIHDSTHIRWDKGCTGIVLNGQIKISTDVADPAIVREDGSKEPLISNLIKEKEIENWNDWNVDSVKFETPFLINQIGGYSFTVPKATFAHTNRNGLPAGIQERYQVLHNEDKSLPTPDAIPFNGLFFEDINMKMPKQFNIKDTNYQSITLKAATLLNATGFSLYVKVDEYMKEKSGCLGGWGFSIDKIELLLVKNSFRKGSMEGQIWVPLQDINDKEGIKYTSILTYNTDKSKLNYVFNIDKIENARRKFLKYCSVGLDSSSTITAYTDDNGFAVIANLNGSLGMTVKDPKFELTAVSFQDLGISNRDKDGNAKLVLSVGKWGFGPSKAPTSSGGRSKENTSSSGDGDKSKKELYEGKVGPFSCKIHMPEFSINGNKLQLGLGGGVDLGFGDKAMASAGLKAHLEATLEYTNDATLITLRDYNFKVDEISLGGQIGPVTIKGLLTFYNEDATFGDGIKGGVTCEFPIVGDKKLSIASVVQFGKTIGAKPINYFFVDASCMLPSAIDIMPPYVSFTGFGGGVWKNMVLEEGSTPKISNDESNKDTSALANKGVGESLSGCRYVPVKDGTATTYGFNARVYFGACSAFGGVKTYNGILSLTATTEGGALQSIAIGGQIKAIGNGKPPDNTESSGIFTGGVKATIVCIGDGEKKPSFDLKANVTAKFNYLVEAEISASLELLIEKGENGARRFCIGKPTYENVAIAEDGTVSGPVSLTAQLDFLEGLAKAALSAKAYLCVGNEAGLKGYSMPPLPKEICDLLNTPPRTWGVEPKGGGLMTGARLNFDLSLDFGPLYGILKAIIGADLVIRDMKGAICGDGTTIEGLNGYYGIGQVYGFLHGDIGLQIKIFGFEEKFSLCDIRAGAVIAAGMPNPIWMKGVFGVEAELLGGAIKFNTTARFQIGKPCEIYDDPLKELIIVESITPGVKTIEEITPKDNNVTNEELEKQPGRANIFSAIKIATNVNMNKAFYLSSTNSNGEKVPRTYQFTFVEAKIVNEATKQTIRMATSPVSPQSTGFEHKMKSENRLETNTTYMAIVTVRIQEHRDNAYRNPVGEKGVYSDAQCMRSDTVFFRTCDLPHTISRENIKCAFPLDKQYEAFVNSGQMGYLVQQDNQKYLFNNLDKTVLYGGMIGELVSLERTISIGNNSQMPTNKPIYFAYKYRDALYYENDKTFPGISFTFPEGLKEDCIYELNFYIAEKDPNALAQQEASFKKEDTSLVIFSTGRTSGKLPDNGSNTPNIGTNDFIKVRDAMEGKFGKGLQSDNPINQWQSKNVDSKINPGNLAGAKNKGAGIALRTNEISGMKEIAGAFGNKNANMPGAGGAGNNMKPTMGQPPPSSPIPSAANYSTIPANELMGNFTIDNKAGGHGTGVGWNAAGLQRFNKNMHLDFQASARTELRSINSDKIKTLENNSDSSGIAIKEQARLDKTKEIKNLILKKIFTYHFHKSLFKDIKTKMAYIKAFSGAEYNLFAKLRKNAEAYQPDPHMYDIYYQHNHVSVSEGIRITNDDKDYKQRMFVPFMVIQLPPSTTIVEAFGGKAFESTNAIEQPSMFSIVSEFPEGDPSLTYWETYVMPFLNLLKNNNAVNLDFLYPGNNNYGMLSAQKFKESVKNMSLWHPELSASLDNYQKRLTDEEIKNPGSLYYTRPKGLGYSPFVTYRHINKMYTARHFMSAAALAYDMYENDRLCKKPKVAGKNIIIYNTDNTVGDQITGYFDVMYNNGKNIVNNINFNIKEPEWCNKDNYCSSGCPSRFLKHTSKHPGSNFLWLAWKWINEYKKGYNNPDFYNMGLGKRRVYFYYDRLGTNMLIKEQDLLPISSPDKYTKPQDPSGTYMK